MDGAKDEDFEAVVYCPEREGSALPEEFRNRIADEIKSAKKFKDMASPANQKINEREQYDNCSTSVHLPAYLGYDILEENMAERFQYLEIEICSKPRKEKIREISAVCYKKQG